MLLAAIALQAAERLAAARPVRRRSSNRIRLWIRAPGISISSARRRNSGAGRSWSAAAKPAPGLRHGRRRSAAKGVEADPYFTPDGGRIWFISSRRDPPAKTGDDLDIWYAERRRGRAAGARRSGCRRRSIRPPPNGFPGPTGRAASISARAGRAASARPTSTARRGKATNWRVTNMGGEVSTAADDYEFEPSPDGSLGRS